MIKNSYGIACVCMQDELKILMVCKRSTYEFNEFVFGKYPTNDNQLIHMFSKMTCDEKLDIMSHNFDQIWWRVFLNEPKKQLYYISKNKFESTFLYDGGARLDKLLRAAKHSSRIWEIPKGHGKKGENEIDAAVREFSEETKISSNDFQIMGGAKKSYSFMDKNITYVNTYYFAFCTKEYDLKIDITDHDQAREVSDIKWLTLSEIQNMGNSGLYKFVRTVFNYARKNG